MGPIQDRVLRRLVAEAVRLRADTLTIEYEDGQEEVAAWRGAIGQGIARLPSSSPEAASLLRELHAIAGQRWGITLDGQEYEVFCRVQESFGEDTFRLELKRVV